MSAGSVLCLQVVDKYSAIIIQGNSSTAYNTSNTSTAVMYQKPNDSLDQETKVSEQKLPAEFAALAGYPHCYWLAAQQEGYSSVGQKRCTSVPVTAGTVTVSALTATGWQLNRRDTLV